jgi:hypothetical protein
LDQTQVEMSSTGVCLVSKKDKKEVFFLNSIDDKEDWKNELVMILNNMKTEALSKKAQK